MALDPALAGTGGYPFTEVDFDSVSDIAWAFYGNGLYGSAALAATADEAFAIAPYAGLPSALTDAWLAKHRAPVGLFTQIVEQNLSGHTSAAWASLFSPSRLLRNIHGPWCYNAYDSTGPAALAGSFEGVIQAALSGDWNTPGNWTFFNFRYKIAG